MIRANQLPRADLIRIVDQLQQMVCVSIATDNKVMTEVFTPDKELGSDFIDEVTALLDEHGLFPEDEKPFEPLPPTPPIVIYTNEDRNDWAFNLPKQETVLFYREEDRAVSIGKVPCGPAELPDFIALAVKIHEEKGGFKAYTPEQWEQIIEDINLKYMVWEEREKLVRTVKNALLARPKEKDGTIRLLLDTNEYLTVHDRAVSLEIEG